MTDTELAANAAAALERLKAEAGEIRAEIDLLHTRLEIVEEVIGMIVGAKRGRPKGGGRKAAVTTEVTEATMPDMTLEIVP